MNALLASFSLVPPVLLGVGLLRWVGLAPSTRLVDITLAAGLSLPLGLGLSSLAHFALLQMMGLPLMASLALEMALAILLAAHHPALGAGWRPPKHDEATRGVVGGATLLLITTVSAAVSFVANLRRLPHGDWDAFAIWNLKARFMFHRPHSLGWLSYWQLKYSHPDYPLLLPGIVAQGWLMVGDAATAFPALIAALFVFGVCTTLMAALWKARGSFHALAGGVLLLGTPFFIRHGASQTADVPISSYILVSIVALWLCHRGEANPRLLVVAGCSAGLASWTKNEGIPFLILVILAAAAFPFRGADLRRRLTNGALTVLGAAPAIAVLSVFKITLAGANNILTRATWGNLAVWARWWLILRRVGQGVIGFGGWPLNPALLLLLSFALGRSRAAEQQASCRASVLLLAMLAVYVGIYVIAPDIEFHLDTSLDRVLLQLWPAWIFCLAAGVPTWPGSQTRMATGWRSRLVQRTVHPHDVHDGPPKN